MQIETKEFDDVLILHLAAETAADKKLVQEILSKCSTGEGLASFSSLNSMVEIKIPKSP